MADFDQKILLEDETFDDLRANANAVLQRLVKDMIDKKSLTGKVTINIDVELEERYIQNPDKDDRFAYIPKFKHKVGSVMQIKNGLEGEVDYGEMEIVFDDELMQYVLRPVTGDAQMSIFDAEFTEMANDDDNDYHSVRIIHEEEDVPEIEEHMSITDSIMEDMSDEFGDEF